MTGEIESFNPFPGLRPFGPEEAHLFFGREQIVDGLLKRLRETRFLGVIGSSGSGKSSLVRAGLIPSLHSGYMTTAGSSWRVAVMRPGSNPIGNLAEALNQTDVLGDSAEKQGASPLLTEVTLRRSSLGLIECVRLARLPPEDNVLIVVDQFEELFRFRRHDQSEQARDEAIAFVKRLLSVAFQYVEPIYIVFTMRSDFIGDCIEYPGLPEAINEGQFLVPNMTRDQLRSAITGPILVGGGKIAPRLLVRLLNEVGDHSDRLPVLQHALMRTWNNWEEVRTGAEPIDIQHYEAIGTMEHALSAHAEEAYDELSSERARIIAARVFKAITDTRSDDRGIRRPTSIERLCHITEASPDELTAVIDVFRISGRSFLMPPNDKPLGPETVIDISHESLMRVWDRLIAWTKEETRSAQIYLRLARAAARYERGTTGLWRDPDLTIALNWRQEAAPTEAWASRHDATFSRAMAFLDDSKSERDRLSAAIAKARRTRLQTAWGVSVVLLAFAVYAFIQQQRAQDESRRAEQNFHLAVRAVDEMLTDIAVEDSLADIPQTEELRQNLLEKAGTFLATLREDEAADPDFRLETALAQVRLGRIYDIQGRRAEAGAAHLESIKQLGLLHNEFKDRPDFQHRLGEAYDWFGEHLRPFDSARAEAAYEGALALQRDLVERFPGMFDYQYELARTYNNRGILIANQHDRFDEAEASFTRSIELFRALREKRGEVSDSLRLARTKNNFAIMLRAFGRYAAAELQYHEAIEIMRGLVDASPQKREYREGLARMYNNLGNLLLVQSSFETALEANTEARRLFERLAAPIPSLRSEIANSYNTRGQILRKLKRPGEAAHAYRTALEQFEQLAKELPEFAEDPVLNQRNGNALANLAILRSAQGEFDASIALVSRAINFYQDAVNSSASSSDFERNLSNAYWLLADIHLKAGDYSGAVPAIEELAETRADKNTNFRAAVLYTRVAALVLADRKLTAQQRDNMEESYQQRTVSLLARAIALGYSRGDVAANEKFVSLRNRDDYREIFGNNSNSQE